MTFASPDFQKMYCVPLFPIVSRFFPEKEKDIVRQCLVAALDGSFFPDWEFQTLFGIDRKTLAEIVDSWPHIDDTEENIFLAVNNSLANLVGYPHGSAEEWKKYISATPDEVRNILEYWKSGYDTLAEL